VQYVADAPLAADELGECDPDAQLISVRETQTLQGEQDTVLHEAVHALESLLSLKLKHDDVVRLTTGIHALLRDNPKLVSYLRRRV
jgi:hypothetical protein